MGKTSKRRPCCTGREEQNLRDLYAFGKIKFVEYERRYKELKRQGLIKRDGRVVT